MKLYTEEQVKDLTYYKANAEEDYLTTPISVLRYISELENLTPIELPSDEEIEKESSQWWGPSAFRGGAQWVIRQIKQQENGK